MHCKDTILRTQNNCHYSKLIPNSGIDASCQVIYFRYILTHSAMVIEVLLIVMVLCSDYLYQIGRYCHLVLHQTAVPSFSS